MSARGGGGEICPTGTRERSGSLFDPGPESAHHHHHHRRCPARVSSSSCRRQRPGRTIPCSARIQISPAFPNGRCRRRGRPCTWIWWGDQSACTGGARDAKTRTSRRPPLFFARHDSHRRPDAALARRMRVRVSSAGPTIAASTIAAPSLLLPFTSPQSSLLALSFQARQASHRKRRTADCRFRRQHQRGGPGRRGKARKEAVLVSCSPFPETLFFFWEASPGGVVIVVVVPWRYRALEHRVSSTRAHAHTLTMHASPVRVKNCPAPLRVRWLRCQSISQPPRD